MSSPGKASCCMWCAYLLDQPNRPSSLYARSRGWPRFVPKPPCSSLAAPALIRFDPGITRHIDDSCPIFERTFQGLEKRQRSKRVYCKHLSQLLDRIVQERRHRAGAKRAGVVDDHIQAFHLGGRSSDGFSMSWVGDVAGDGRDACVAKRCLASRSFAASRPVISTAQPSFASAWASVLPRPQILPL